MTEILFGTVFSFGIGYLCGKLFKGLNPFYLFFGGIILFIPSAQFLIQMDSYLYTSAFIIGFVNNYGNPFRRIMEAFEEFKIGWMYRREIAKASSKLNSQKEDIEAELNRQREEAERKIYEQEKRAEEHLRRESEKLEREREQFRHEQQKQRGQNQQYQSQQKKRHQSSGDTSDTRSHEEILGLKQGYTKQDLKGAYRKQCARLHPDKWHDRPEHIRKAMEEEQKRVNEAYKILNARF